MLRRRIREEGRWWRQVPIAVYLIATISQIQLVCGDSPGALLQALCAQVTSISSGLAVLSGEGQYSLSVPLVPSSALGLQVSWLPASGCSASVAAFVLTLCKFTVNSELVTHWFLTVFGFMSIMNDSSMGGGADSLESAMGDSQGRGTAQEVGNAMCEPQGGQQY